MPPYAPLTLNDKGYVQDHGNLSPHRCKQ